MTESNHRHICDQRLILCQPSHRTQQDRWCHVLDVRKRVARRCRRYWFHWTFKYRLQRHEEDTTTTPPLMSNLRLHLPESRHLSVSGMVHSGDVSVIRKTELRLSINAHSMNWSDWSIFTIFNDSLLKLIVLIGYFITFLVIKQADQHIQTGLTEVYNKHLNAPAPVTATGRNHR